VRNGVRTIARALPGLGAALLGAALLPACWVSETRESPLVEESDFSKPERIRENIAKLGDKDLPDPVSDTVIWELCQAGKAAEEPLVEALRDENSQRRARVLLVLGLFRNPALVKSIAPCLRDPVLEVALAASAALVRHGYRDGLPVLIRGLRHENPRMREWCALRLFDATGLHFGFHAGDPLDRREFSIRKWENWWKAEGATFALNAQDQ
jgi:HEAT repeat protein